MGLRHPVPFAGEWLQIAGLEGRNTLCFSTGCSNPDKALNKGEEADHGVRLLETATEFENILLKAFPSNDRRKGEDRRASWS